MKYLYAFIFLFLVAIAAQGQSDTTLLAAKQNGKWGYINKNKEWIISPIYESTIPFDSREITWATYKGQSILIDRTGTPIENLSFDNVTEIYDNIILYRQNNKTGWYNRNTSTLYQAAHLSIDYLERQGILIVQDSGKYQVFNEDHTSLTDTVYDLISDLGTYLYTTQGELHGVINSLGKEIIPTKYRNIIQSGNFLLAQDKEFLMHVFSMEGQALLSGKFENVNHLLGSYFATKRDNRWNLEDAKTNTIKDSLADNYSILTADYVLIIKDNLRGIFNLTTQEVILPAEYTDIRPLNGSKRLAVAKNNKYALFSNFGDSLSQHLYHGISDFDSLGSAKTYINGKIGLIDSTGIQILPTNYETLSLGSDRIAKGKNQNGVTLYEFDDQWQIIDSILFKKAMTMQLGGIVSMGQNIGMDATSANQNTVSDGWYRDSTFRWGYRNQDGRILLRPIFNSIEKIQGTDYVLGTMNTFKKSGLSHSSELIQKKQYGLVNEQEFKILTPLNLKYIDTQNLTDTSTKVYRVMLSSGHMATLRKDNNRLISYQSRYIGEFVNGYARIFIGTKMRVTSNSKKFPTVINIKEYAREFGFTYRQARAFSKEERFECDGYWAYLGPDGKFIIHPDYFMDMKLVEARDFKNERAIVKDSKGYGLINYDGNFILNLSYDTISYLENSNDSLLLVQVTKPRYGYVSTSGKVISNPQYTRAEDFSSGHAWAFTDASTILLSKKGPVLEQQGIYKTTPFADGIAGVAQKYRYAVVDTTWTSSTDYLYSKVGQTSDGMTPLRRKGKYFYADENGNPMLNGNYTKAGPFVNGIALVRIKKRGSSYYGYINKSEEFVVPAKYRRAEQMDENGFALVSGKAGKGIVSSNGKIVVPPRFKKAFIADDVLIGAGRHKTFLYSKEGKKLKKIKGRNKNGISDDLIVIRRKNIYGAYNSKGENVLPFDFKGLKDFERGVAPCQDGKYINVINHNGDTISRFAGRSKEGFSNGLLLIKRGDRYLFVDQFGKNKFNKYFSNAEPFENGLAIIKEKDKYGLINTQGEYLILPNYAILEAPKDGVCKVAQTNVIGICDLNSKYIVAPECSEIVFLQDEDVFRFTHKNEYGYFTSTGEIIWSVD